MILLLTIRNAEVLEDGMTAQYLMEGETAVLGRSRNCNWHLPDPQNAISSRHCEIRRDRDFFILKDLSTNGTFVNDAVERMTEEHLINAGDLIRIGQYEVVASFETETVAAAEPEPEAEPAAPEAPAEPIAVEPPAEPIAAEPPAAPAEPEPVVEPALPEPAAAEPAVPEPVMEAAPVEATEPEPVGEPAVSEPVAAEPAAPEPVMEAPAPIEAVAPPPVETPPATEAPPPAPAEPEAETAPLENMTIMLDSLADIAIDRERGYFGVKAGSLLKRLVAGLIVMVEARARAKAQMGAEMTGLMLEGNNPIKFARSPEQALAQLLMPPQPGFMDADKAVEDAYMDLQSHQVATLKAIPGAIRSTLDRFSPGSIRRRAENMGVLARILPGARDAALWRNYEREFVAVKKESDEAFMEVFSKEFRKAYERQLREG